jgi:hypothetical protein
VAEPSDEIQSEHTAQCIADSDATNTSQKPCGKSGQRFQLVLEDQIAGEHQQRLIRDREPNDSEHEQPEDPHIAVMGHPAKY